MAIIVKHKRLFCFVIFDCALIHAMHHAWPCSALTGTSSEPSSPQISSPAAMSPTSSTSEPVSPFAHSEHLPFKYAQRVLDWHKDPHIALRTQGYYKAHIPERARLKCITRHCIPFIIEQYYRKLAIPLTRQRFGDPGEEPYVTLNFPGAIKLHNGKVETGIFAIGFDPSHRHEIYHRCFHTNNLSPQLVSALGYHTYATQLFPDEVDANFVTTDLDPDYLVQENDFTVQITNRTKPEITYILYKSHITLPKLPFVSELFKKQNSIDFAH